MKKVLLILLGIGLLVGLLINPISDWVGIPRTFGTFAWAGLGLVAGFLVFVVGASKK